MKAEVISGGIEDLQYKIDFFRVSDKLKSSSIRENRVSNALYFLYPGSNPQKICFSENISNPKSDHETKWVIEYDSYYMNQFLSDIETDES